MSLESITKDTRIFSARHTRADEFKIFGETYKHSGRMANRKETGTGRRLLNHLVRSQQHVRRDCQIDLLCCFEVDDELKLRGLLNENVGGLCPFQNYRPLWRLNCLIRRGCY